MAAAKCTFICSFKYMTVQNINENEDSTASAGFKCNINLVGEK